MATRRISGADFRKLRPSRRISGVFFSLSIAPHERGPKWACVVSKKVSVKAPTRNLIKRRVRSILAIELKNKHEKLALVFQARKGTAGASFAEMKKDIETLLKRASLTDASH